MGDRSSARAPGLRARLARLSIRWKLTIVLGLAILIPLGALAAWDFTEGRRQMVKLADRELLGHGRNAADAMEAYLAERRLDAQTVAMGPLPIRAVGGGAPLSEAEHRIMEGRIEGDRRSHGYLRAALLRADGTPVATVGAAIPFQGTESQRAFRQALAGSPAVSNPFFAGPEGPYILDVAAPVQDAAGANRGVLLFALPFERIAVIAETAADRVGPGSIMVVLDEHMIRIAAPSPSLIGRPLVPLPDDLRRTLVQNQRFGAGTEQLVGQALHLPKLAEAVTRLRARPNAPPFFDDAPVTTGKRIRVVVVLLRTAPWAFSIAAPYEVLLAPVRASLLRNLTAFAVATGLMAIIVWGLGGIMTRRLSRLAEAADRLATGDLAARVEAGPGDEIGRVARSFNAMAQAAQAHQAATRDRIARLEALNEVGRAVSSTLDLNETLALVVEKSVDVLSVHAAAILAADPASGVLRITKAQGVPGDYISAYTLGPGEGVAGTALREGCPIWTEDLQADSRFPRPEGRRALLAAAGIRATLAVPIHTPAGLYGVLSLYRHDPHPFDPDEIRVATLLAAQAGNAIENARLFQQEQERRRQVEAVRAVSEDITRELNPSSLLSLIQRRAVELVGASSASVWLWDEAGQFLAPHTWHGLAEWMRDVRLRLGEGLMGTVAERRQGMIVNDYRSSSHAHPIALERTGIAAILAEPLLYRGRLLGVISLHNEASGQRFSEQDRQTLALFAAQAAIAIENARLYEQVQAQAEELERRVAERTADLEAANKELQAFSYSVSHDLRAPLRAVDGFSRILLEEHAPHLAPDAQRYLRMVRENAQRMGLLIDDLLNLSRLSRQSLRVQPVAPAPLVREALDGLRAEQAERRVEVSLGDLPVCLADPALLRQVFANLLANALKFTRRRPDARIEVGCRKTAGECIYFVRDNGVGFDMRYADKLFGVFQRLHSAEEYEGTGVGLAIVQRIIHRHGGRVWAEAEVGRGATFHFTLGGPAPAPV